MSEALLEQFLIESREILQRVGEVLIELEEGGEEGELLKELFRLVHTLKGNSGLFDFSSMTKLLHAAEDLMSLLRDGKIKYSQEIADLLLETMDLVSLMLDEIEREGKPSAESNLKAEEKTKVLREFKGGEGKETLQKESCSKDYPEKPPRYDEAIISKIKLIPERERQKAFKEAFEKGKNLFYFIYQPEKECFYKGEDPFYLVRTTPELLWIKAYLREEIKDPTLMDLYSCFINFDGLSLASKEELSEHFKYVLDQINFYELSPLLLIWPCGEKNGGPVYEDFIEEARKFLKEGDLETFKRAIKSLLELSAEELYVASVLRWIELLVDFFPKTKAILEGLLEGLKVEFNILPYLLEEEKISMEESSKREKEVALSEEEKGYPQEFKKIPEFQEKVLLSLSSQSNPLTKKNTLDSVILVLENMLNSLGEKELLENLKVVTSKVTPEDFSPLLEWINSLLRTKGSPEIEKKKPEKEGVEPKAEEREKEKEVSQGVQVSKILRVDEAKVDRLMNLIGEFVVAKNSLPYLAKKAEEVFEVPELAKEIKAQFGVLNRIAEEMQDAIMQIRMVPVSTIFQRFPRLVRDLSKKLNKKIKFLMEGEETEGDKNVLEALGDPLIHLIRNSLDHGIEPPEERVAQGKPETGTLILRAKHEGDRLLIEVEDDGKGIDPERIKMKAYQKGLITEEQLEKIGDEEALNLIFLSGLSTKEVASDLSGRGVGMDVVKTTIERFGGEVKIHSQKGKGTLITLSLPLSMAVTHVLIIETASQKFGIPLEAVLETVRVSKEKIHFLKKKKTMVWRNRVIPLFSLNELLGFEREHLVNEEGEYAVLVSSIQGEVVGLIVDKFREREDLIVKPLTGLFASLKIFAGTAILGDGSVLLILNLKELVYGYRN